MVAYADAYAYAYAYAEQGKARQGSGNGAGTGTGTGSAAEQIAAHNIRFVLQLELQAQLRVGLTVRVSQQLVEWLLLLLRLLLLLPDDNLRSELLRIFDAVGIGIAGIGHRRGGAEQRVGSVSGANVAASSAADAGAA